MTCNRIFKKYLIITIFLLTSCTPITYTRPNTTPNEYLIDDARCKIFAQANSQDNRTFYGSPSYVLGAQIGSALRQAINQSLLHQNCMISNAYLPQSN